MQGEGAGMELAEPGQGAAQRRQAGGRDPGREQQPGAAPLHRQQGGCDQARDQGGPQPGRAQEGDVEFHQDRRPAARRGRRPGGGAATPQPLAALPGSAPAQVEGAQRQADGEEEEDGEAGADAAALLLVAGILVVDEVTLAFELPCAAVVSPIGTSSRAKLVLPSAM